MNTALTRSRLTTMGRTRSARLLAVALALLAGLLVAPAANAGTGGPRILITGDSITQGAQGDHTWRYFFAEAVPEADYVGNKTGPFHQPTFDFDYQGEDAYAVSGWDSAHAATYGARLTNTDPDPGLGQLPIGTLTATHQPDVILSAWGINDLRYGHSPASLIAATSRWIAEARAENPDVDFVISELAWTWMADGTRTYNALLADLAAQHDTAGSRVVIARMGESYTREADTHDGIHPNLAGEQKIARMMLAAYHRLGDEPAFVEPAPVEEPVAEEPTTTPTLRAPARPKSVRAVRRARRVVVRWKAAPRAESYLVRCGTRRTVVRGTKARLVSRARKCRVRARNSAGASAWTWTRVRT
ncbi:MAG: GDSL-type esterase/lipase family protein [Nocardioides sp.]|nr:GDSL-type esterase/lipase family protein [Nocardioides sp.]